jgi:polysaccharide biosynthesis protein PslH
MRILVIDRTPPTDERQGNALIGRNLFPRLARRHDLVLVAPVEPEREAEERALLADAFGDVRLIPRVGPIRTLAGLAEPAALTSRLGARIAPDRAAFVRALRGELARILADDRIDAIHVRQLPMAAYIDRRWEQPTVLELVDSESLQARRRLRGRAPMSWMRFAAARAAERRFISRASACTTVSRADAAAVRARVPGRSVEVIPNGVDATFFAPRESPEEHGLMVFHGAMSFPPNVEAARWAALEVLPILRQRVEGARLAIVGRDPATSVTALASLPGVTVTGAVEDVRPWLARAEVVICPMRSGSGIKNKILEAMAMARPMVTTPLGLEGLEARAGEHLELGSDARSFATSVAELMDDAARRRRLGAAAHLLVRERYTWDACADAYDRLYLRLLGRES